MNDIPKFTAIRLCIAVAILATLPAAAEERRALLIGIDDYTASTLRPATIEPGAEASKATGRTAWPDLHGAVNDARALREMLVSRYGFPRQRIELLTGQDATRGAILQAIERCLVVPAGKGDHVVFYFAGHGSRLPNPNSDERDGLDETLVPADSRWGAPDLRDKELRRRFNQILDRGARLTVILDSCYSGSGARGLPRWTRARGLEADPRQAPSPAADRSEPGPRPEERGALVLSATQDDQRAWETRDEDDNGRGAFSLALVRAMRASGPQEPAEHVFQRAVAQLRIERAQQHPVLAGTAAVRTAQLFGGRADHRAGQTVVAVREIAADGTVFLHGGWANGMTVGSELRLLGHGNGGGMGLRVTALDGLSSSRAEIIERDRAAGPARLAPGALLELSGWAAPPGPPLRVWIPRAVQDFRSLAREIRKAAAEAGIGWSVDPVDDGPTHVLLWRGRSWYLMGPDGEPVELGTELTAPSVIGRLRGEGPGVRLFVHLPAPAGLVRGLGIGPGTPHDAVEPTDDPRRADYFLVGRLQGGELEYAWARPLVSREDQERSPLPLRSDWFPMTNAAGGSSPPVRQLESAALRLAKLRAWLDLESPPGNDFAYRLALKAEDGSVTTGGTLAVETRLGLVLRLRQPAPPAVVPRHAYVFSIDSFGKSTLLFPASALGSVENRAPLGNHGPRALPSEIPLGRQPLFKVSEPFGNDTYFLLTSQEPIPNPWVLEYPGVRIRGPEGRTALEELLSLTGATTRSSERLVTPTSWSLERLFFESVASSSGS